MCDNDDRCIFKNWKKILKGEGDTMNNNENYEEDEF